MRENKRRQVKKTSLILLQQEKKNKNIDLHKLKQELKNKQNELSSLISPLLAQRSKEPPQNILKRKILELNISRLEMEIRSASNHEENEHEKEEKANIVLKKKNIQFIPNRLTPRLGRTSCDLFTKMNEKQQDKWISRRSNEMRASILGEKLANVRINKVDICSECGTQCIVNKEVAMSVCQKCGNCKSFASHIFEIKDNEKDQIIRKVPNHMEKFATQYETTTVITPVDVLDKLTTSYRKIHTHNINKVETHKTSNIIKSHKTISNHYTNSAERISKRLIGEGIPEFTQNQVNTILNMRKLLSKYNTDNTKSFTNHAYLSTFGLANRFANSRLLTKPKTNGIHIKKINSIIKDCNAYIDAVNNQSIPLEEKKKLTYGAHLYPT